MHEVFERLDVLDAIGTVKNFGDLVERQLEHSLNAVCIVVLCHAEFDLEALAVDSRDDTVAEYGLFLFDLASPHYRPFGTRYCRLFLGGTCASG